MKIVLNKNKLVIALHCEGQDIFGLYPGCLIMTVPDGTPVDTEQEWSVGLDSAKAAAIMAAAAACDAVLKPLASRVSEYETKTWQKQLAEAQDLLSDPSLSAASYPTIAGIIAVTGEDAAAFAAAIIKNDEDWTAITAYAIGQRQRIVAQIKECGTPEEVAAVDVKITLPS